MRTVLDTRPNATASFAAILRSADIGILHIPMIRMESVEMNDDIAAALQNLSHYDGVLLTSMNAVRYFAALLRTSAIETDRLPPIFVVGPKTAELARRENLSVQSLPSESYGATMAAQLPDVRDRRFLQPCADIAREETADVIRSRGGQIDQLAVYRTLPPTGEDAMRLMKAAIQGAYDCAAFFSPSAVRHYAAILTEAERPAAAIAVIGDTTAAEAKACGMQADIVPTQQTAEALAEAIIAWTKD